MAARLPVPTARDWTDSAPPDPLDAPELYDGVLWRRPLAHLLDLFLLSVVLLAGLFLSSVITALSLGVLGPLQVAFMALLPSIYAGATIEWLGGTPGMRAVGLTVRDWKGRQARLAQGFLMALLFYASVAVTTWLILVVALFSDRRRTVHDMLAGTVVVRSGR
jgi:uncharacterized RDD family membrane protein YckC